MFLFVVMVDCYECSHNSAWSHGRCTSLCQNTAAVCNQVFNAALCGCHTLNVCYVCQWSKTRPEDADRGLGAMMNSWRGPVTAFFSGTQFSLYSLQSVPAGIRLAITTRTTTVVTKSCSNNLFFWTKRVTVTSDGPGSSKFCPWSLGWLRTGAPFEGP